MDPDRNRNETVDVNHIDEDNNQTQRNEGRIENNDAVLNSARNQTEVEVWTVPPVATFFALLLVVIYFFRDYIITGKESIRVSWDDVITNREAWRLIVAHFFHFEKFQLFLNVITLLSFGRFLEPKLKKFAMTALILLMGIITNLFFLLVSASVCWGSQSEFTFGLSNVFSGFRVVLAYVRDPQIYQYSFLFGLDPFIRENWSHWQSIAEVIILKICIPETNIAGPTSGILAGFIVAFIPILFPKIIIYQPVICALSSRQTEVETETTTNINNNKSPPSPVLSQLLEVFPTLCIQSSLLKLTSSTKIKLEAL